MNQTSVSAFTDSCLSARWTISLLLLAFVAAVIFHIQMLLPYFHSGIGVYYALDGSTTVGNFIGDEALYRLYAESIRHLERYPPGAAYPPLYPLLLAFAALLSPAAPIEGMIVLNILTATAVIFPVYALARQILSRDFALGAALVTGFLPASFVFTPALMSENLSTTLFVVAFWLAVRRRPATLLVAGLFGLVGAFCFLTKFIFLAALPFIDAAFIFNQWSLASKLSENSRRAHIVRLGVVAAAAGVTPVLLLWGAYVILSGGNLNQVLGFHVAKQGFSAHLPALAYLPSILGLNGLALIASAMPVLPALLVGIAGRQCSIVSLYAYLLGSLTAFLWLFVAGFAWVAVGVFGYPQPICQRYFMMLVPIFVPLAFVGVESVVSREKMRRGAVTLFIVGLLSLTLAIIVQAGLYDRTIWSVPAWTTIIWVGGCDVLYGALGFPVIVVTGAALAVLIVLRLVSAYNWRSALISPQVIRFGAIAVSTVCLAVFNVQAGLSGARFAWADPFLEINAAHARAITKIIGGRGQDARPVLVTVDPAVIASIEKSSGIKINRPLWWVNFSFWNGRRIIINTDDERSEQQPDYWIRMALDDAALFTTYTVGTEKFQVIAAPR